MEMGPNQRPRHPANTNGLQTDASNSMDTSSPGQKLFISYAALIRNSSCVRLNTESIEPLLLGFDVLCFAKQSFAHWYVN